MAISSKPTGFTAAMRAAILRLPEGAEFCSRDYKEMCKAFGNSERGLSKSLSRMCNHGEIVETKRTKSRRGKDTIWYKASPNALREEERRRLIASTGLWAGLLVA